MCLLLHVVKVEPGIKYIIQFVDIINNSFRSPFPYRLVLSSFSSCSFLVLSSFSLFWLVLFSFSPRSFLVLSSFSLFQLVLSLFSLCSRLVLSSFSPRSLLVLSVWEASSVCVEQGRPVLTTSQSQILADSPPTWRQFDSTLNALASVWSGQLRTNCSTSSSPCLQVDCSSHDVFRRFEHRSISCWCSKQDFAMS